VGAETCRQFALLVPSRFEGVSPRRDVAAGRILVWFLSQKPRDKNELSTASKEPRERSRWYAKAICVGTDQIPNESPVGGDGTLLDEG